MRNPCRGALRHWVIGCGVIVLILIVLLAGSGYYVYRRVAPKTFSTAGKIDPPKNAPQEMLLPERAGDFTRGEIRNAQPNADKPVSVSGVLAEYRKADTGETVIVTVGNSEEQRKAEQQKPEVRQSMEGAPPDMGFSMKIPFGPEKTQFAFWMKPNWTYMAQTTSTEVLDFVEAFNPVATDETTTTSAGTGE